MPHWKKLMDPKDMLFAYDLDGRDVTVTISHITGGELTGEQGRKTKKPIAHIAGKPKKLALNNTNCQTIEQLTGTSDYEKWRGVRVTLFPTTTNFGGKTVECIRIRPYHPKEKEDRAGKGRSEGKRDSAIDTSAGPSVAQVRAANVAHTEAEWASDMERRKAIAERVLGRSLAPDDQMTEDEARVVREALAAADAEATDAMNDVPGDDHGE